MFLGKLDCVQVEVAYCKGCKMMGKQSPDKERMKDKRSKELKVKLKTEILN